MELRATFIIDVDEKDTTECGHCVSKKFAPSGFSGKLSYRCVYFDILLHSIKRDAEVFGEDEPTERCMECIRRFRI